jgi:2-methylisocitrate lyase-like PEP mutase family enzyme
VNIISIGDNALSPGRLAELGVARVSFGPGPYRLAMKVVADAARAVFAAQAAA